MNDSLSFIYLSRIRILFVSYVYDNETLDCRYQLCIQKSNNFLTFKIAFSAYFNAILSIIYLFTLDRFSLENIYSLHEDEHHILQR
jgi:hypothetical protein